MISPSVCYEEKIINLLFTCVYIIVYIHKLVDFIMSITRINHDNHTNGLVRTLTLIYGLDEIKNHIVASASSLATDDPKRNYYAPLGIDQNGNKSFHSICELRIHGIKYLLIN